MPARIKSKTASGAKTVSGGSYRHLLAHMMDAFVYVEMDGRIVNHNRPFLDMLGYSADELGNLTYNGLTPEKWHAMEAEIIARQVLVRGYSDIYEKEYRRRDGTIFPVELRTMLETGRGGKPVGMWAIVRDISGRKRADEALREGEQRLRAIIDAAPFGAHLYQRGEDNRLVFLGANRSADRILGVDHRDFVGKTIEEAFPNLLATEVPEAYRRVAATGENFSVDQVDYDEGSIRGAFEVHAVQTGPNRMVAFFRDITERKRAEVALRESEERFRDQASLLDLAHDAILVRDLDDRVRYWNRGAERLYGWPAAEMIGESTRERLHCDPHAFDDAKRMLLETGEWSGEMRQLTRGGAGIVVNSSWSLVRDARDRPKSILVISTDISPHKKLEEQLLQSQKMEAVGRLAGGVAHDFNNLLTVILGFSQLMLMKPDIDDASRGNLGQILLAAEGASNLTRQLLTFSRKHVMQLRELDLGEVVGHLAKMLRRIIGEDISLTLSSSPGLPAVQADPGMVEQVVLNLAVNSRDAMPRGGTLCVNTGAITLQAHDLGLHPRGRTGEFVCLEVADTGCGMEPEVLNRLFEPFFTTKEIGKGTGLGLATIYGIVQQHNGWIEVESRVNAGTTFRVYLPAVDRRRGYDPQMADEQEIRGGRETILLVEDDDLVRAMSRSFLSGLGYRVLEASSGPVARGVWAGHGPQIDLLITDMVMPGGISGSELAAGLRGERPDLKVIFTSGYSRGGITEGTDLPEGADFVRKPFNLRQLAGTVRRVLDQKSDS
jgi:PAS domain S-box-containing protein